MKKYCLLLLIPIAAFLLTPNFTFAQDNSSKPMCYHMSEMLAVSVFNFFTAQGVAAARCDALTKSDKFTKLATEVFKTHQETSKKFVTPMQSYVKRNNINNLEYVGTLSDQVTVNVYSNPISPESCQNFYEELELRKEKWGRIIGQIMAEHALLKDTEHYKQAICKDN